MHLFLYLALEKSLLSLSYIYLGGVAAHLNQITIGASDFTNYGALNIAGTIGTNLYMGGVVGYANKTPIERFYNKATGDNAINLTSTITTRTHCGGVIGQAASFLFSLFFLYRHKESFGFDFKKESFRIHGHYAKMIASLGTPMAIQSGCINVSMLFVNSMINEVGVVASATFGVGCRIDDIANKISQGIHYAAMPMISQNIAAKQQKRAVKVVHWAWIFSAIMTVMFMTAYVCFGKQLFMAFSDDPRVHEMSGTFIRAILWMFPALAVMRGSSAFIQGIGNAKLSMVLALLDGVVLRIGLSWLFGIVLDWGFYGFVLGYGLAAYGCAIPGMAYFFSGLWKKRRTLADEM